jgi:hypothetical protein
MIKIKLNKSSLDFINKNIKNNSKSISYPIRKQQDKVVCRSNITPTKP